MPFASPRGSSRRRRAGLVEAAGIDPVKIARHLWQKTRLNDSQDHHEAGLASRPETRSIASASDDAERGPISFSWAERTTVERSYAPTPGPLTQTTAPALPTTIVGTISYHGSLIRLILRSWLPLAPVVS
jgi:hypothetical protein